jgi:ketosteroid isomerase-like protein
MVSDAGTVLQGSWACWRARDKAATLAHFADDVVYAMYIPQNTLPFGGGPTVGKLALSDRLQAVLDQFDTLTYAGTLGGVLGERARGLVRFHFRHRRTGEEIDGVMRHVATVRGGLIVAFEEYHDIERVKAFMRLVSHAASSHDGQP